jgi:hypothetical protein
MVENSSSTFIVINFLYLLTCLACLQTELEYLTRVKFLSGVGFVLLGKVFNVLADFLNRIYA